MPINLVFWLFFFNVPPPRSVRDIVTRCWLYNLILSFNKCVIISYFLPEEFLASAPNSEELFIHSGYFYSASSSPVLLGGTPDTARILFRSFTLKRHRKLRAKDLPKSPVLLNRFEPATLRTKGSESTNLLL